MKLEQLKASYWLDKLWVYLLHLKDNASLVIHNSSLLPIVVSLFCFLLAIFILRKILLIRKSFREVSVLLELTPPSFTEQEAYTTDQLFSIIHALGNQRSFKDRLLGIKPRFSLEIVSTQNLGIRYLIRTTPKYANTLRRSLLSYLPHLSIKTANEYLPESSEKIQRYFYKTLEFRLAKHFAFPLRKQDQLYKHDPIAYITGQMTKLEPGELISLQLVVTPARNRQINNVSALISANGNVIKYLKTPGILKGLLYNSYRVPYTKSPSEQEVIKQIDGKISQSLFKTTVRLLLISQSKEELSERAQGIRSAFSTFSFNHYQSLISGRYLNIRKLKAYLFFLFKKRLHSLTKTSFLSISEVSGIYHFPYTSMAKTEDLVKVHSKNLPAPLSLKKDDKDIIFARNFYGGTFTNIGLTQEERIRHVYIIGATGWSTGPHLHFTVKVFGIPVNPHTFLDAGNP